MSLKEYHRRRRFKKTSEPYGSEKIKKGAKRLYVVQKHAASHLHYDFRLELDGVLKSWAVPKGPSLDPKIKHLAIQVEDHPIEYANFEGIIPQGEYGGGTVMIWDTGFWEPLGDVQQAFQNGNLTFNVNGKKLHGLWKLIRLKSRGQNRPKEQWLLFKVRDNFSRSEEEYDVKKIEAYSVQSNRSIEQIAEDKSEVLARVPKKTKMPTFIKPELATLVRSPPSGEQWLHEIKWDGYRILALVVKDNVRLLTRRGNDWAYQFPALVKDLTSINIKNTVLDGEVIALDKNMKANFQILQNSLKEGNFDVNLVYYVFDLLYYDGYSLLDVPLIKRKELLEKIITSQFASTIIKYNDHILGQGEDVYKNACKYELEGIISKLANSSYKQKRTRDWLKIKCSLRQEFIIGGYTDPKSSRQYFGALLLGFYDEEQNLIYCGKVGTGFTYDSLKQIFSTLRNYEKKECPFISFPEPIKKSIHWLQPNLIAEVEYLEMTSEGLLRHPSFKGLREDKPSKKVKLELSPAAGKVRFTNLHRVLYPEQGITKYDLVNYYETVSDWILPHIKNRPLTLVRCPTSNHKKCFYQKHMDENFPEPVKSISIFERDRYESYVYIHDVDGLLGLVQIDVLEIHPWGSHISNIEQPDQITFDLDPDADVDWSEVIQCANYLHEFLNLLRLKNFVKTTGGKGLHIVVPIKPSITWDELRDFTRQIADLMVQTNPNKYISTMSKAKRKGKIFIDYLRNTRGATAIAPFSTRIHSHAPIAVPLSWDELSIDIKSDSFNIQNIYERLKRLKTHPWENFFKTKQTITDKIRKKIGVM